MRFSQLADRSVALLGYGVEARALLPHWRRALPDKELLVLTNGPEVELQHGPLVKVEAGEVSATRLADFDVVIKAPGFSPYRDPVAGALAAGVQFSSASAIWFAENRDQEIICITGSKGKSTSSALLHHLLRSSGFNSQLAGNIGHHMFELDSQQMKSHHLKSHHLKSHQLKSHHSKSHHSKSHHSKSHHSKSHQGVDYWIIELSSYQTWDSLTEARISIAVVLNLFPEHLDWHGSIDQYYKDKLRLLQIGSGLPIINGANQTLTRLAPTNPKLLRFGIETEIHCRDDQVFDGQDRLFSLRSIDAPMFLAPHNQSNLCAALTVAKQLGVDLAECADALPSFRGLPHRQQVLGRQDGLTWIDDSLATTPHASIAAIQAFAGHRLTVLVGGHDRGISWQCFADFLEHHPGIRVITMPTNGDKIAELLGRLAEASSSRIEVQVSDGLDDAVSMARRLASAGDTVLLSPGAPSYGAFRNYKERGREFARLAGFEVDQPETSGIE